MEKINVLMVGSTLDVKGGITTVLQGFINNEFKNSKLFYVPTYVEKSRIQQILFYFRALFKIILNLIFNKIDIVHIHVSERGSFTRKNIVFKLAKIFRKKVIVHMHGAEFKEFYSESSNKKQKKILNFLIKADSVIVLGNSWNKYVKSLDTRINTIIIPNFVKYTEESATFDAKKTVNILFLAVVTKRKGIFDLIKSINLLKDDLKDDKYKINVIIAGSGAEEIEAKQMVKDLELEEYFAFVGWVNNQEKKELLSKSQIFVLPSYNEGLPMSILEAMSYGLPVVTTRVGSIEDAIKNNYNGLVIEPGDVNGLKEKFTYLITNEEACIKFSKNSKELVKKVYDDRIYFTKIEELYTVLKEDKV